MGLGSVYYYARNQKHVAAMATGGGAEGIMLIIDPGHGGVDGGAVSLSGAHESDLNLAVGLKLEALAALYGIPASMTRRTTDLDYPEEADTIRAKKVADTRARVAQINETPNAVVISIHQNIFEGSSVSGPQILFADTAVSEEFALHMQEALLTAIQPEKKRAPSRVSRNVYLMNHIDCPAILVECGFLSNPWEEALLQTDSYQRKLAAGLLAGFIQSREILEARYLGGSGIT